MEKVLEEITLQKPHNRIPFAVFHCQMAGISLDEGLSLFGEFFYCFDFSSEWVRQIEPEYVH